MSLPVSEALVAASNVYTWEPPNRVIAARYGLTPADILRFDTNTSPAGPAFLAEALQGPWDPALNEYPDSTYAELAEAAAAYVGADPAEILVGCGADEVLDVIAKTFLAPGSGSLVPTPTYGMYAVLASQRDARPLAVPRLGASDGFAIDLPAVLVAADVKIVQEQLDGLVLVCRAGSSTRASINSTISQLGRERIQGLLMLNVQNRYIPR